MVACKGVTTLAYEGAVRFRVPVYDVFGKPLSVLVMRHFQSLCAL
jgi:hypothetical protein